jgi:hypothetical protein
MLILSSCSIPCSECDVSGSLGFRPRFAPDFSDAIVCLGRLRLQMLTFKSQRLGFLSKTARFQPSFLEWVSSLGHFAGFYGAASSLYSGKCDVLGFTGSLRSSIASQGRFSSEVSRVCTFATKNLKAFDCFAKSSHYFEKYAALDFTDSL